VLKKWKCQQCGRVVLGFEEDIMREALNCLVELIPSRMSQQSHSCCFVPAPESDQQLHTLHGEAGFFTEGTSLDSSDTIHDYCTRLTQQAEDDRELKAYLDARRNQ